MARSVSALLSCDVILFRVKFQRIRVYPRYNIFSRRQSGLCNKSAASQPLFVPLWSRSGGETEANTPRGALLTPLKGSRSRGGWGWGGAYCLGGCMGGAMLCCWLRPFIVCFAADKTNLPRCSFSEHSGQTLLFCLLVEVEAPRQLQRRHINKARHIPPPLHWTALCWKW